MHAVVLSICVTCVTSQSLLYVLAIGAESFLNTLLHYAWIYNDMQCTTYIYTLLQESFICMFIVTQFTLFGDYFGDSRPWSMDCSSI